MKAELRRKEIAQMLLAAQSPVSGSALAAQFGVSRQIIVQDISVLKAGGYDILSTHFGYVVQHSPTAERVFKVKHSSEDTQTELHSIVSLGGTVVDVFVRHKVYGKISVALNIFTEYHIAKFMEGVRTGKSSELMHITGGYHYHTVRADSPAILDRIQQALAERGFLAATESF